MDGVTEEKVLANVKMRQHADDILEMVADEAEASYGDDNDMRLKFLNYIYYRMAERCGLVPHGEERKHWKPTVPERKEKKPRRRKRVSGERGTVFVPMEGSVIRETERAFIIKCRNRVEEIVPKSQLRQGIDEGDEIEGLWVTEWIADQKNWERD